MNDKKVNQSARAPMGAFSLLRRACSSSVASCTNDLVHLVLALGVLTSAVACLSRRGSESGSGAAPSTGGANPSDTMPSEGGQSGIGGSATEVDVTSGGVGGASRTTALTLSGGTGMIASGGTSSCVVLGSRCQTADECCVNGRLLDCVDHVCKDIQPSYPGGNTSTGGAPGTGGVAGTGGAPVTGGIAATGGASTSGGSMAIGGSSSATSLAAGGVIATGGGCEQGISEVITLAMSRSPQGVAVDATSVYWTSDSSSPGQTDGSVQKVSLAGGTPVSIARSGSHPSDIVVDESAVYWTDNVNTIGAVLKVSKEGGDVIALASDQNNPSGLAVVGSHVYWSVRGASASSTGLLLTVGIDGGSPSTLVTQSGYAIGEVAADATSLYWPRGDGTLQKVSVAGGTPTTLLSGQRINRFTLTGSSIYWSSSDGMIITVSTDGGAPMVLASGQNRPGAIAVDSANIYWVNSGSQNDTDGSVMKVALSGGTPVPVACQQGHPWAIAVDATNVYWVNNGTRLTSNGNVMKAAK